MRKYIKSLVLVIVLVCQMYMPFIYGATSTNSNNAKLDAVLVIDSSGSMQDTDPNKLGLEGVKLFVDMLSNSGNQVGVVTYGHEVDQVYPMTQIKSQNDREAVKSFVNGITRDLNYTDITAGIGEAIRILDSRDKSIGGHPIIIVFTDGNNAIGGVQNRTNADIASDLSQEIAQANNSNYPIYTIGLNGNGKLNEAYLEDIARQTNGLAFATNNPNDLPSILTQIFATYSNLKVQNMPSMTGTGNYEEVVVNIPNGNVLEANIAATSNNPISFKLKDPSGNEIAIPSANVTLHDSNNYHLLKVSKPMQGNWKLYVKGVKGDQIDIDLVYNYDIDVAIKSLSQTQFNKGDLLSITAYLALQGAQIDDPSLYQNAVATAVLVDDKGNETKTQLVTNNNQFEGSIKLKDEGNFEVYVVVDDSSYQRQSHFVTISVGKGVTKGLQQTPSGHEEESNLRLYIGLVILLIGSIIAVVIMIKKMQSAKRPLVGQVVVEIRDNTTGKITPPQYKKLNVFQGKVSLHALLAFAPEYKAAANIMFKSAANDQVLLFNASEYTVEKAGRALNTEGGLALKKGDRLRINMADCGVTIQLEYLL